MGSHGYEIVETLGEGGMGTVHRAVHHPSGREVAIKTVRPSVASDALLRRLLLDEATAAARLRHPAIVEMLDVGEDERGRPFLVMELVEGTHLGRMMNAWPGWPVLARVLDDALAGLVTAHAAGIVHCDLKPDNLLVDAHGQGKIADFGVARVFDPLAETPASRRSGIAGTPAYMPPEQLTNDRVGPWSDLYAFGVLLHRLLSGETPFRGRTFTELHARKTAPPPPLVCRAGLEIPEGLRRLIRALLRPHPRERPRFACEVRAELAELATAVVDRISRPSSPDGLAEDAATGSDRTQRDTRSAGAIGDAPTRAPSSAGPAPRVVALLPAAPDAHPGASLQRLRQPELVGRAAERHAIEEARDAVLAEQGARIVLLRGGAGVGKSRLARWALADVEARGAMDGVVATYDLGRARLEGLDEAMLRLLGRPGPETDGPIPEWAWLERAGATPEDLRHAASWLAPGADRLPPARAASAAWRALRAASRVRPVLLWLDDVAWAQDGALELLELLAEQPEPNVLLIATMREGTAQHPRVAARLESLARRDRVTSQPVSPLRPAEVVELIQAVVPLEPEIAHALAPALDGTPLVAVQLLHDWLDAGALVAGPAAFRLREGESVANLLATRPIESILARRLSGVLTAFGASASVAERVLLRAALLGSRFERRALLAATRAHAELLAVVDAVLDRALLNGVVRAEGRGEYRFDHGKLHEALIARGGADVQQACRDAAEAVLATYSSELPEVMVQAALLLRRAGDRERALELWTQAAISAGNSGDDVEARRLLVVARDWIAEDGLPPVHPRRAALDLGEAYVHYYGLRYPAALEAIARARAQQDALGDVPGLINGRTLEAAVLFHTGRFRESERVMLQLVAERGAQLEPADHVRITQRFSELAMAREDLDAAIRYALESYRWAEVMGLRWRRDLMALNLAELNLVRGDLDEAAARLAPVEDTDEHGQRRYLHGEIAETRAQFQYCRGDFAAAREILAPRARRVEMLGDGWRLTAVRLLEAMIAVRIDPAEAVATAVRALVSAFREVPRDESFTLFGLDRLAADLEARGEPALAAEARSLLHERRAYRRRGWDEPPRS